MRSESFMVQIYKYIVRDLRRWLRSLSPREQAVFAVIWLLMVLRAVFPILHMPNGYVLYLYPFQESELCETVACDLDRSRTFAASATLGLTALGIGVLLRKRRNLKI
ncbi:MAG: hypothetical protein COU11_02165 [Candidatus Harrisonbacteria bacterium CG10_big_fil_rev_8_21_14_0_10_49_15]|uniref:Uncharacterized protein n=1 Tax=Candidatus Harrisonbacteria bacterium CG10_big_fil_rev_8_21_14_0_10_49_15 TaxID=1974587 RepID=A0A2H0UKT0_9BACT|nr:MAG: hypothetical protein COU11_02165 [Candidatus Harrisonbacteria bacterium CG10_big_fil_rev_8_21_14_0_10_49_15]